MDNELNDNIRQKARELARQITVAHDLDPEIQEELYGHIEDKLLAYRSGEEPVTDEDAFILVREHFGDAKALKALFQDVHAEAFQVTLVRRVLALVVVLLVAHIVSAGVSALAHMVSMPLFVSNTLTDTFRFQLYVTYPLNIFMLVGTCGVLYRWKHGLRTGKVPWFCRWPMLRMVKWIVVLLLLRGVVPHLAFSSPASPNPISHLEWGLLYGYGVVNLGGYCVLWLWWADVLAGRLVQQLLVGTMWVGYSLVLMLYPVRLMIQLGSGDATAGGRLPIAEFHLGNVEVLGYFFYFIPGPESLWFFLTMPFSQIVCVFLCTVVLQAAHHPWRKESEINPVKDLPW